jgi:hypothetical protein
MLSCLSEVPMSEQKPPGAAGYISQILQFVDSPFKLAAVIVLFVVGGLGWVAYDKRDQLLESWLTPSAASLDTAAVPAALEKLIAESGADLVQIWSVDLSVNSQRFVAARRKDGERPVIPEPRRLPAVVKATDLKVLADVIAGHPTCVDIFSTSPSPVAHRLAERGNKRACAVPIPPSPDAFLGIIYLAWQTPPDAGAEDVAVSAAREIAGKLVTR